MSTIPTELNSFTPVTSPNDFNEEAFERRMAELARRKNDPEHIAYTERLLEGAMEARRRIEEREQKLSKESK